MGPQKLTVHKAADQLLDILQLNKLRLALPQGSVTWEAKKSGRKATSTIDLVFVGPTLWNRILECQVRKDLGHGSDHFPVSTEIAVMPAQAPQIQQRSWKRMNTEMIEAGTQCLLLPTQLNSKAAIDQYTSYLTSFTQELIEQSVPWGKPSNKAVLWWNLEVEQAVYTERQARRKWERTGLEQNWEHWQKAGKAKRELIGHTMRKCFRKAIHEAAKERNGIWKLAKWGRTKAQDPNELPIMPALVTPQGNISACNLANCLACNWPNWVA
jgi:hypothetical protein